MLLSPARSTILVLFMAMALFIGCGAETGQQTGTSQTQTPSSEGRKGKIEPPKEPEEALLELSYRGGMIANPDPTSFVRVYPGGRVLIHYPAYMKKAGDYELQLEPDQVEALLASFSSEGVLTLEENQMFAMAEELQPELSELEIDDHGVESVVRIRGESFTPEDANTPTIIDIDRTIRAPKHLLGIAPTSPFENLKNLAAGVEQLEDLARSDALQKIDP